MQDAPVARDDSIELPVPAISARMGRDGSMTITLKMSPADVATLVRRAEEAAEKEPRGGHFRAID